MGYSTMLMGKGFDQPRNSVKQIVKYLIENPFQTETEIQILNSALASSDLDGLPLFIMCDDAGFVAKTINNFVWVSFTRSNPSHDIYGVDSFQQNKHWGSKGSLIIDARIKPHHAPVLELDEEVEKRVDQIISRIN